MEKLDQDLEKVILNRIKEKEFITEEVIISIF